MAASSHSFASARCNCERISFSNHLAPVTHRLRSSVAAAPPPALTSSASPLATTPALSNCTSSAPSPALATPSLPGVKSFISTSASPSAADKQHDKHVDEASPDASIDLARLNSLLFQLAQPVEAPAAYTTAAPSASASPSSSSSAAATPRLTPRLRGNGTLREPRDKRAERKSKFESLLDTFHQATFCTFEPQQSSYHLSASDLVSAFDEQGQAITPIAPNDVLRGIASSMTEPAVQHQAASGSLPSEENPGKLIQASGIAAPYQEAIKEAIQARVDAGKSRPKLVGILATPSPPSVAYAEWTRKACEAVGIEFEIWKTWDDAAVAANDEGGEANHAGTAPDFDLEADVEDLIIAANADDKVHGIMVYYPIFHGRQDTYLQQIVDPRKDVEGLHFSYCWNMYHNVRWVAPKQLGNAPGTTQEVSEGADQEASRKLEETDGEQVPPGMAKSILPCTPLAMVKCLESIGVYDRNLPYGDRLYGKTITVVNRSEVVGRPLAALLSNDGAKVYSVDIDSIQDEKNFEKDVRTRAGMYLPAIGKTTIAMLQRNLLRLVEYRELAQK
ncbi:uncharacterized protein PFL1_02021 [Pseudozyma flocculosa PF-1]|uniref:uncharacterized protein n=1 Tax=Pseudozyma flocculosa PF-1 TaxID=1277687 RepID=UPI00045616E1|nr:uncharacterized protein PFL1_02021 [Pseudozyma flocculosa PF-1]EPQ30495.1 hypothetical protein PFL1_02021 [Pseudozyma flocculosa PF-1]